ncbi:MAG: ABC transporter permease [Bernardetiaceae bacterium]|nr:ABC transporter permease [Bernardetiaceae bacterium]
MQKIILVMQREFLIRVKKKSFIIMSIIGPLLAVGIIVLPIFLASLDGEQKRIEILDESGMLTQDIEAVDNIDFVFVKGSLSEERKAKVAKEGASLLHIPKDFSIENPQDIKLYSDKTISVPTKMLIERQIRKQIEAIRMERAGIDKELLAATKVSFSLALRELSPSEGKDGAKSDVMIATGVGYVSAFLIYFFIFLYGSQVRQGVVEEKTNRIIEVIISSIKPFELMLGKILGIAGVAMLQFLIWIGLTLGTVSFLSLFFNLGAGAEADLASSPEMAEMSSELAMKGSEFLTELYTLNLPLIIAAFGFYFLFGYLIYGALFGAVGAATDNETDSQQFILPITMPLIAAILIASFVIKEPDGSIAFWASMFPLTSPIIMMMRIPFGVAAWEILLSMSILILAFLGATWVAGRIYRIGILMYGKKVNYKDLGKWLFMNN